MARLPQAIIYGEGMGICWSGILNLFLVDDSELFLELRFQRPEKSWTLCMNIIICLLLSIDIPRASFSIIAPFLDPAFEFNGDSIKPLCNFSERFGS